MRKGELVPQVVAELERVGSRAVEDRIARARADGLNLLPLQGGPVRPLPEHVREAILDAIDGDRRPSRGIVELRYAIADQLRVDCGLALDPETELLVTNGAMHALSVLFRAVLEPGDRVVIPTPTFFFEGMIRLMGAEPVYVPSKPETGWSWDLDRLCEALDDRTKLFVASNPVNPTGYLPARAELDAILSAAREVGAAVVSDESYERLVYEEGAFSPLGSAVDDLEGVVVIRSMSKSFAMANWRVGFLAAPSPVVDACQKILEWDCIHCAYVAQRAANAAIRGPRAWLADVVSEYERRRDLAYAAAVATGRLRCARPPAGPFLFLDAPQTAGDGETLAEELLGVGVPTVPGRYFRAPGHVRMAFGGESETISALGDALQAWAQAPRASASRVNYRVGLAATHGREGVTDGG